MDANNNLTNLIADATYMVEHALLRATESLATNTDSTELLFLHAHIKNSTRVHLLPFDENHMLFWNRIKDKPAAMDYLLATVAELRLRVFSVTDAWQDLIANVAISTTIASNVSVSDSIKDTYGNAEDVTKRLTIDPWIIVVTLLFYGALTTGELRDKYQTTLEAKPKVKEKAK